MMLRRMPGLKNLGNTCYVNTILQLLFHNKHMRNLILSLETKDAVDGESFMLRDLFEKMDRFSPNDSDNVSCKLEEFIKSLQIDVSKVGDAHEFLLYLITRLFPPTSDIAHVVRGKMKYETTCFNCKTVSPRECDFSDLSLPVVNCSNLYESLDAFFSTETVTGDNRFDCPTCKCKNDAQKKIELLELPEILLIHLSRYEMDPSIGAVRKLQDKIHIPEILETSTFLDSSSKLSYKLKWAPFRF